MASVEYLSGNERPTAALMEAVWGEFETRTAKILSGGKSFILARDSNLPKKLIGKVFYFTSGLPVYATRIPGPMSASVPVPYDHTLFTDYISGIDPLDVTWDDTNRIATIPRVSDSDYDSLEVPGDDDAFGFFEHSLQVATLQHAGTGDADPQTYYVQDGPTAVSERRLKFALAEIVIEGPTSVNLPTEWDKYSCFRVHNLNPDSATVTFDDAYSLTLQPFECRTIRRDSPTSGYRSPTHYFFQFEPGDPRFFWFLPTTVTVVGASIVPVIGDGPRAVNSMQANNLTHAALLHDWVNWLGIDEQFIVNIAGLSNGVIENPDTSHRYAWFVRDPHALWSADAMESAGFGDPSDSATILGDLLHHQGEIIIARWSKTEVDESTGDPILTWDTVTFRGYSTIVEDFVAKMLTVSEDGSGDLVISNTDPNSDVDLIPISTNLLKSGETLPVVVDLNAGGVDTPFTIEHAVFEIPPAGATDFDLSATPPLSVYQRSLQSQTNEREYQDIDTDTGDLIIPAPTVSGPDLHFTQVDSTPVHAAIHGIHALTVGDVLDLHFWGNQTLVSQDTAQVNFTGAALELTWEGLVLTFSEVITNTPPDPFTVDADDWYYWQTGQFSRKRAIKFRGHGWGYNSGIDGSWHAAYSTPRYGAWSVLNNFTGDTRADDGADFGWQRLIATESKYKVLTRIKKEGLTIASRDSRFWQTRFGSAQAFLANYLTDSWYIDAKSGLIDGTVTDDSLQAMALLPEHYNGLAQAVNQLTTGGMLSGAALFWRAPSGNLVSLAPTLETLPIPMDCYASFGSSSGDDLNWLYSTALGLTVKGETDFPDTTSDFEDDVSLAGIVRFDGGPSTGSVTSVHVVSTDGTADGSLTASYSIDLDASIYPVSEFKDGTGSGAHYLGTWAPSDSLPSTVGSGYGEYYVVSESDYSPDFGIWFLKGEIIYNNGFDVWVRLSSAMQTPSYAFSPQVNGWWQLRPTSVGDIDLITGIPPIAYRSRGTWDPAGSLPTGSFLRGDFYDVTQTSGGYTKGSRIIWDGSAWQIAAHNYADFNWISITQVQGWLEAHGFSMILNELIIPMKLERLDCTDSELAEYSVTTISGTVTMTSVGFNSSGGGVMGGVLLAAQAIPLSHGSFGKLATEARYPGTRLQFSTVTADATWKLRRDWWTLLSGYNDTRNRVVDLKNWTDRDDDTELPPLLASQGVAISFESNHASLGNWPVNFGWQITPQVGGDSTSGAIALNMVETANSPMATDTAYVSLEWTNCSRWAQGAIMDSNNRAFSPAISAVSPWQYAVYALHSVNSTGVANATKIKITPCGCWGWDGDAFKVDLQGLVRFAWGGVATPVWNAADGLEQNLTPGSGITYLKAPEGTQAFLMPQLHVNSVALS